MPISDEEVEDSFFDTVDYIRPSFDSASFDDVVNPNEDAVLSEFEIWRNEPSSVHKRRDLFLTTMGFNEFAASRSFGAREIKESSSSLKVMGSERITASSGAVSSSSSGNGTDEISICSIKDLDSGKQFVIHELGEDGALNSLREVGSNRLVTMQEFEASLGLSCSVRGLDRREVSACPEKNSKNLEIVKAKRKNWWKSFNVRRQWGGGTCKCDVSTMDRQVPVTPRMRVRQHRKRCMEFSAVYMGQEIRAHKGSIWTMKFSLDGKYLASGGEDGVVRVWRVTEGRASCKFVDKEKEAKFGLGRKNSNPASVIIPEKVFKIEETPIQEFRGHTGDVLDLSWSKSNCLLSSSKDKTVRLWQVGRDECLKVFQHNNYVTCIQFNPVDDRYFISGSIDGKVRIWGVLENRVVDWADVRDIVTAVCYRPDGQGCIVGSITGSCRFYNASGNHLQLDAQLCVQGRKKSTGKRITGFKFSPEDSQSIMITSADSKVRIFDGVDLVHKFRGLWKSGSQMSASFTSNGRYIVSVGEDSHIYVWNYEGLGVRQAKTVRACERFSSEGVLVAVPWSGMNTNQTGLSNCNLPCSSVPPEHLEASPCLRDSDRFSLGGWFFADGPSRGSATWPEEKLPVWSVPVEGQEPHHHLHHHISLSATWGLVIVTAGCDGTIKSFHNYGLPVRL